MERSWSDSFLIGGMTVVGLAETAHLIGVVLGWSFSDVYQLFLIELCSVSIVAAMMLVMLAFFGEKDRKEGNWKIENWKIKNWKVKLLFRKREFAFGLLAICLLYALSVPQESYFDGDMTVETVNSFLVSDGIYTKNPLTGQEYTQGIPSRIKILCLPTLYAIVTKFLQIDAITFVGNIVAVIVLLGSLLAFEAVARAIFPQENREKLYFLAFVLVILLVGNYRYGMDGFAAQYAAFRGVSVRMLVLIPYTFSLLLRRKWRLLPFCVLAEACITWTLYGMGACFFIIVVMTVLLLLYNQGKGVSSDRPVNVDRVNALTQSSAVKKEVDSCKK